MTKQTTTPSADGLDIPSFLKRDKAEVKSTAPAPAPQATIKSKSGVTLANPSAPKATTGAKRVGKLAAAPLKSSSVARSLVGDAKVVPTKRDAYLKGIQDKAKPAKQVKPAKQAKAAKPAGVVSTAHGETPHKASTVVATPANPQKSIVPMGFKKAYAQHNDTCGDQIGLVLKEATTARNEHGRESLDVKALAEIAAANGIDFSAYAHLNPGQQRMNVGNRLRGNLKRGVTVVIGKRKFADQSKALAKDAA